MKTKKRIKRKIKDFFFRTFVHPLGPGFDSAPRMLGYHSVEENASEVSIPPDLFRREIEWSLDRGYRICTLKEWWEMRGSGERALERVVVITFDDGFKGVLWNAAPILGEFGLAATVFVITDSIGKDNSFDDRLGVRRFPMLSWSEIETLKKLGWDIQSHGRHHYPMVGLSPPTLEDELAGSKALLEERLGGPVDFFCYPYGIFDEATVSAVRQAGYSGAVTCWAGTLTNGIESDPYRLRRIMLDGVGTEPDFAFRFSPAYRYAAEMWFGLHRLFNRHIAYPPSERDGALSEPILRQT